MGEILERVFQRDESFFSSRKLPKIQEWGKSGGELNQTKEAFWNVLALEFGELYYSLSWSAVDLRALSVRKQGFLKWISIKTWRFSTGNIQFENIHSKSISVSKLCGVMTTLETSRHISRCNYLRRAAFVNLKMTTKYKLRKKEKTWKS